MWRGSNVRRGIKCPGYGATPRERGWSRCRDESPIDRALLRSRVNSSPGGSGAHVHNTEARALEERIAENVARLLEQAL